MDRRTFIRIASSASLAGPVAALAQQNVKEQRPVKSFRIGYLSLRAGPTAWDEAFVQRLRELGDRIGDNLRVEFRWAAYFIDGASDLPEAFAAIAQARSQALVVKNNSLTYELRAAIIESSRRLRVPDMYGARELVAAGGLVAYGPDISDLYLRAAGYVDRTFKGAKPADLPVEQPIKFDLALNLKDAKAIGLAISQSLLLRADEVVQ